MAEPRLVARRGVVALLAGAVAFGSACTERRADAASAMLADTVVGPGRWVRDGDSAMRHVVRVGRFADRDFKEASGLIHATSEPGVFWGLNDSGNDERLFAFDSTGRALGAVRVRGAENVDWEALATGPCPDGRCLYIADVGDNDAKRSRVVIWRIPEPTLATRTTAPATPLAIRYADGPHDVEAVYAAPDTSLWLITKRPRLNARAEPRPSRMYRIPAEAWNAAGTITLSVADSVPVTPVRGAAHDWITDASLSEETDGRRRLVLLSYGAVHVFDTDPVTGRPGALLARCALPITEKNAEGVAWLPDGRILVANEGRGGAMYAGWCP